MPLVLCKVSNHCALCESVIVLLSAGIIPEELQRLVVFKAE